MIVVANPLMARDSYHDQENQARTKINISELAVCGR
jgi:hypothetical protein